jgi:hypothetical protein
MAFQGLRVESPPLADWVESFRSVQVLVYVRYIRFGTWICGRKSKIFYCIHLHEFKFNNLVVSSPPPSSSSYKPLNYSKVSISNPLRIYFLALYMLESACIKQMILVDATKWVLCLLKYISLHQRLMAILYTTVILS